MAINPRHLHHLLAIDRAGSLMRAAELLNISQPSLSVSMNRLEDVLNVRLLERDRRGARLTPAGKILARHAHSLEMVLQNATKELDQSSRGIAGPLVIGGSPLATESIIPAVLARLSKENTRLSCDVLEAPDEALANGLLNQEIDVVINTISNHGAIMPARLELSRMSLFKARIVLVVRRGHALSGRSELSLKKLDDQLWVMPSDGSAFRRQVEALFTVSGLPFPTNLIQTSSFSLLKQLVRRTDGITILSDQIVRSELEDGSLVAIRLRERIANRTFGIQTLKGRQLNPFAQRFIAIAKDIAPEYELGKRRPQRR